MPRAQSCIVVCVVLSALALTAIWSYSSVIPDVTLLSHFSGAVTTTLTENFAHFVSSTPSSFNSTPSTLSDYGKASNDIYETSIDPLWTSGPDLIVMGSTNGGTSTLNDLLNDLHGFYTHKSHGRTARQDMLYWDNRCKGRIVNVTRKVRQIAKCSVANYLAALGVNAATKSDGLYHWERSSDYNRDSQTMQILAKHFKRTKYILTVRDSFAQILSRIKNFKCVGAQYNTVCVERVLQHTFINVLYPPANTTNTLLFELLNQDQTKAVREQIISLFNARQILSHETMDVCPYINVLVMLDNLEKYNDVYGVANFKIMQFEDMIRNIKLTAMRVYCFVSSQQMDQCIKRMMQLNMKEYTDVVDHTDQWFSVKNDKGQKKRYSWKLKNMFLFEQLNAWNDICDARLNQLLVDRNYSIVLGGFNVTKWSDIRHAIHFSVSH